MPQTETPPTAMSPRDTLCWVARHLEHGQRREALQLLDALCPPSKPMRTEALVVNLISLALRKRAEGAREQAGNIYLQDDQAQHMRLFTVMRRQVPVVYGL